MFFIPHHHTYLMEKHNLISKIKEKKELSSLPDSFVQDALEEVLKKLQIQDLAVLKKAEQKIVIKEVRANLRRHTGMFQISRKAWKARESLLAQGNYEDLLKTHTSTNERLTEYPKIKAMIASFHPTSILDLGSGLNPIALATPEVQYYAVDIQEADLALVDQFFKAKGISGKTIVKDLSKSLEGLPKADLCLCFKLLDIVEKKGHRQAEEILKTISCKNFIISFSTTTLSGKPMLHKKRPWLERLLKRLHYLYTTQTIDNEVFYLIEKS